MRYTSISVARSTGHFRRLGRLKLRGGLLWPTYCQLLYEKDECSRVFLAKDEDDHVRGWLLYQPRNPVNDYHLQVYVNKKYRRKGVASRLVRMALKQWAADPLHRELPYVYDTTLKPVLDQVILKELVKVDKPRTHR